MIVRFNVVSPASKRKTFTVRLPILIGRGDEAKFRVQHDLVSRRHCEFFERDGKVYVRDLGSTNGTFLNDEQIPLSTKTPVPSGATVRVGPLSFTVDCHSQGVSHVGVPVAETADDRKAGRTDVTVGVAHADLDAGADGSDMLDVEHVAAEHSAVAHAVGHEAADRGGPAAVAEPVAIVAVDPVVSSVVAHPHVADEQPAVTPHEPPDDDELNNFFKGLK